MGGGQGWHARVTRRDPLVRDDASLRITAILSWNIPEWGRGGKERSYCGPNAQDNPDDPRGLDDALKTMECEGRSS